MIHFVDEMLDSPGEELICRIFEQAIEDYVFLKNKNIIQYKDRNSMYSLKDIECFFGSSWCAKLLDMIDCQLTGNDILKRIKRVRFGIETIGGQLCTQ